MSQPPFQHEAAAAGQRDAARVLRVDAELDALGAEVSKGIGGEQADAFGHVAVVLLRLADPVGHRKSRNGPAPGTTGPQLQLAQVAAALTMPQAERELLP